MSVPAKLAFSSKYVGYEICGALVSLDQSFCEESDMAEVYNCGRDFFPERGSMEGSEGVRRVITA